MVHGQTRNPSLSTVNHVKHSFTKRNQEGTAPASQHLWTPEVQVRRRHDLHAPSPKDSRGADRTLGTAWCALHVTSVILSMSRDLAAAPWVHLGRRRLLWYENIAAEHCIMAHMAQHAWLMIPNSWQLIQHEKPGKGSLPCRVPSFMPSKCIHRTLQLLQRVTSETSSAEIFKTSAPWMRFSLFKGLGSARSSENYPQTPIYQKTPVISSAVLPTYVATATHAPGQHLSFFMQLARDSGI